MMRGFLLLALCVCSLSFTFQDFRLDTAGSVIANVISKELMSFEPINTNGMELQTAKTCLNAWNAAAGNFGFDSVCNPVVDVFKGLNNANWTDGAVAAYLDNYCNANGAFCYNKYHTFWNTILKPGNCAVYDPSLWTSGGNQTDQFGRTLKALVNVVCSNDTTPYTAPGYTDPNNSSLVVPSIQYNVTYCWLHFKWLLATNLSTVNDTYLDGVCSPCALAITDWIIKNGVNALALAARQARAYCDKKYDPGTMNLVYCAPKLQALEIASEDPNFMTVLKTNTTAGLQAIQTFCHPCVKWYMELAKEVTDLIEYYSPGSIDPSLSAQLLQTQQGLSLSCVRNLNGAYCVDLLEKYDFTTLTTLFKPCIPFGCTAQTPTCKPIINAFYREIGCCLAVFMRGLPLATDPAAQAAAGIVPTILKSCGMDTTQIPSTCSQKKITVTLPLRNIAYDFAVMVKDSWKLWFASSLGIDVVFITDVECWVYNATINTTICNVTFFPDDDQSSAPDFLNNFAWNCQNNMQYFQEFDIASLENNSHNGGPRVYPDQDAYEASDFSAESTNSCLTALSPAQGILVNGTCVPVCEDKIKDDDESDVDCGGTGCARCGQGQTCNTNDDCLPQFTCRQVCAKGTCSMQCSGVAALLANPLLLLVGVFMALFLL